MDMPEKDQVSVLYTATKIKRGREVAKAKMIERGIHETCIDLVSPVLAGGYDAGEKFCAGKKSEMRGAWEAVTQERFGTDKANGWQAPELQFAQTSAQLRSQSESLRDSLPELRHALEVAESVQAGITRHTWTSGQKYKCPECDAALIVRNHALVLDDVGADVEPALEEQKKALADVAAARAELEQAQRAIEATELQLDQIANTKKIQDEQTVAATKYFEWYGHWDKAQAALSAGGIIN